MRAKKRAKVEKAVEKMLESEKPYNSISFHHNKASSRMVICGGMMIIENYQDMPNRWHRFWYKRLLGWEWEKVDKK